MDGSPHHREEASGRRLLALSLLALGIVYGDIGTSPLYAMRECFAGTQKPKSYVGYSRGSVCQACGGVIKPAEIEYDVADGTAELRLDAACYALFSEAWGDRAASDAPAATDD